MITNNALDPNCYMTSKVVDMSPQGLLKITLKQDEFNIKHDNADLMVCDYYDDGGESRVAEEKSDEFVNIRTSTFVYAFVNDDGELEEYHDGHEEKLQLGKTVYFYVVFSAENIDPIWRIRLLDENNEYPDSEKARLEKLMVLNKIDDHFVSLRPGKAGSLKGKKFILSVSDENGDYYSEKIMEVDK